MRDRTARSAAFTALLLASATGVACLPKPAAQEPPKSQERVVSAADGSKTAAGYDKAAGLAADAKGIDGTDSKSLFKAASLHRDASAAAAATLKLVEDLKAGFKWTGGLKYKTATGETMTEEEILAALKKIQEDDAAAADEVSPKLAEAFKHDYKDASADQIEALTKYGPPDSVEDAPGAPAAAKKPKKGKKPKKPECWKWSNDKLDASTCWTAEGTVASHEENPKLSDEEKAAQQEAEEQKSKQALRIEFSSCKSMFGACPTLLYRGGQQGCIGGTTWLAADKFPAKLEFRMHGSDVLLAVDLPEGDQEIRVDFDCKVTMKHYRPGE